MTVVLFNIFPNRLSEASAECINDEGFSLSSGDFGVDIDLTVLTVQKANKPL